MSQVLGSGGIYTRPVSGVRWGIILVSPSSILGRICQEDHSLSKMQNTSYSHIPKLNRSNAMECMDPNCHGDCLICVLAWEQNALWDENSIPTVESTTTPLWTSGERLSLPETNENSTLALGTLTYSELVELLGMRMTTQLKTAISYVEEHNDPMKAMDYLTAAVHNLHDWVEANQAVATGWTGSTLLPLVHAKSFSYGVESELPNPLCAHSWELLNTPIGNTGLYPTTILIRRTGVFNWNLTRVFGSGLQTTYHREQILRKFTHPPTLRSGRLAYSPCEARSAVIQIHWNLVLLTKHRTRRRSLVLWGVSRSGKTVFARSLGPHLYFCGLYSGAEAIRAPEADYAIFDDIQGGIKFFPGFKNWLGCQVEFQVKLLYRDPILLKWGKPCIWLSNNDPRLDLTEQHEIDWMEANCIFQEIHTPLF